MYRRKLIGSIYQFSNQIIFRSKSDASRSTSVLFFEPKIQELLKKLSTAELDKIFTIRKTGERLKPPEYKFMTDDELRKEISNARIRAEKWQQMPPVLDARKEGEKIICLDPSLDGHEPDGAKLVFTDITFGLTDQERLIVVRENDGTLKHANWDQRHRMTETYLPRTGREITAPPMFEGEHLESLLDRKEYIFILDRACVQYEPDDPEYLRVTSNTYKRIAQEKDFSIINRTRHYGTLLFYLVLNKQVDTLLLENFQNDRLTDAISLIHLYYMIHPDKAEGAESKDGADLIKHFIDNELSNRNVLVLALRTCLERSEGKKVQTEAIEKSHGVESS